MGGKLERPAVYVGHYKKPLSPGGKDYALSGPNPYGFCPICGNPGWERAKGIDGCSNGHKYKTEEALKHDPLG